MPGAEESIPGATENAARCSQAVLLPWKICWARRPLQTPSPLPAAGLGCHLWLLEVVTGRRSPGLDEGCVGRPQTAPLLLGITSQEVGLCPGEASPPLTILFQVITTLISHTNGGVQDDVE